MAASVITLILATATLLLLRARSTQRYPSGRPLDGEAPNGEPAGRSRTRPFAIVAQGHRKGLRSLGNRFTFRNTHGPFRANARSAGGDPWLMPMLVHQLASLLEAGRSPQVVWAEAAASYVRYQESTPRGQDGSFELATDRLLAVLLAADRSAALGHSVAPVLRSHGTGAGRWKGGDAKQRRMDRIWVDLAACWDVAEFSGAPLSRLLSRYAGALEAELDADAARQTALAGPRATVRLLAWLPLFGLGLGLLMGVDPLGILLGTPVGLAALGAGATLMVVGRIWSQRMVAAAEGSS